MDDEGSEEEWKRTEKPMKLERNLKGYRRKWERREWRDALIIVKVIHLWHSQTIKTEQNKTFTRLLNTTCCYKLIGIP